MLERFESVVQNDVRTAPIVFDRASGSEIFDDNGNRYIDFHAAGGSLSFGHNNDKVRSALIDYLNNDRILQTCDRASAAKRKFVEVFVTAILAPQKLNHKILFTDPASGTAAEVALRIARRHKKRASIVAFTNSSHGLTEGALSVTAKQPPRFESVSMRGHTVFMPYCDYFGPNLDTIVYLKRYLEDSASGVDLPAGIIVETMQVHGGMQIASLQWLKGLEELCRRFGVLLIVDETHTGCGRAGGYFSFEQAGLNPDIVVASNAVAGGLPISILLLRPELDHWQKGEQIGIFQGNSLAFVAGAELVELWTKGSFRDVEERSKVLRETLTAAPALFPNRHLVVRGAGMNWALEFRRPGAASVVSAWALEHGLLVEPARHRDDVLLVMPPITIGENVLREGLERLHEVVAMLLRHQ